MRAQHASPAPTCVRAGDVYRDLLHAPRSLPAEAGRARDAPRCRGGAFLFTFRVPPTYPHDAPKVKCLTKVRGGDWGGMEGCGGTGEPVCADGARGNVGPGGGDDAGRRERRLRKDGAGGWRLAAAASPLPEA